MGCCSSKNDVDKKNSWSPAETNNASTTSTIVAQPSDTGTFRNTMTITADESTLNYVTITKIELD